MVPVFCVCRQPEADNDKMIACDECNECMGVPIFMRGSLISYENWAPGVLKIILTWGPGSPNSYEIGDPGSPK